MSQPFTVTRPMTLGSTLTTDGNVNFQSTFYSTYRRTPVTSSSYTATESDELLGVTVSGSCTVTFPDINGLSNPAKQKCFTVVDERGDAGANPITIAAGGSDAILGASSVSLNTDWGSMRFYSVPNVSGAGTAGSWYCAAVVPS